jgi:hypothetical protein
MNLLYIFIFFYVTPCLSSNSQLLLNKTNTDEKNNSEDEIDYYINLQNKVSDLVFQEDYKKAIHIVESDETITKEQSESLIQLIITLSLQQKKKENKNQNNIQSKSNNLKLNNKNNQPLSQKDFSTIINFIIPFLPPSFAMQLRGKKNLKDILPIGAALALKEYLQRKQKQDIQKKLTDQKQKSKSVKKNKIYQDKKLLISDETQETEDEE